MLEKSYAFSRSFVPYYKSLTDIVITVGEWLKKLPAVTVITTTSSGLSTSPSIVLDNDGTNSDDENKSIDELFAFLLYLVEE